MKKYNVFTEKKGSKVVVRSIKDNDGNKVLPLVDNYKDVQDYLDNNVLWVEPMTAKEYLNEEELELMLTSSDYIAEEKLDGTRGTLHLGEFNRLFSRRVSKKTNWFAENTDSVPHIRDRKVPEEYWGTVIDGEMSIMGKDFKAISSTLNCTWDEAIYRQTQLGFIVFNAFDIVYYKGVYVAKKPLIERKQLLHKVIERIHYRYIREVPYTDSTIILDDNLLDKKEWYDTIVQNGGEGLMLKSKTGTYRHTRGREYTKWKKYDTWDVVILDFDNPTEEYTGKELETWQYWGMYRQGELEDIIEGEKPSPYTQDHHVEPVTKFFAKNWIGNVMYGVKVTDKEIEEWKERNPKETIHFKDLDGDKYLYVGQCSGMDDSIREYMTNNQQQLIGTVIEVGANELIKKTGKLRHPRFINFRNDKSPEMCDWKSHIRG